VDRAGGLSRNSRPPVVVLDDSARQKRAKEASMETKQTGERIRTLRERKTWTQEHLAKAASVAAHARAPSVATS
jgi:hypothetical protein